MALSTKRRKVILITLLAAVVVGAGAGTYEYISNTQSSLHGPANELTSYGRITAIDYQGTSVSMVFTSSTDISFYSASISFTANNHANSNQFYQRGQVPIGTQSVYNLREGDNVNMTFTDFPAGSLLLNIVVEVNATAGSRNMLLSYEISQLETNSTQ